MACGVKVCNAGCKVCVLPAPTTLTHTHTCAVVCFSRDGDDDAAGSLFIDDVNTVLEDVHSTLKKNNYYIGDMLKHLKENNYYVEHWGWW